MRRMTTSALAAALAGAWSGGELRAQPEQAPGDAYCDWVEGVAASESALLLAPEVFGSFGAIDQTTVVEAPEAAGDDLRLTLGVRYRLTGIYEGLVTRNRAGADCRRRRALDRVEGATAYRALTARARVLEQALPEAEELLERAGRDFRDRRSTAQEVTATRLRVSELRAEAASTRREIDAVAGSRSSGSMGGALAAYYAADDEVERDEGRLRRARAWDVSVRVGYDRFLEGDEGSPLFALVSVGFNLGSLFQGGANERAAEGRRRLVRQEQGAESASRQSRLRALLRSERRRLEEMGALVADLDQQMEALGEVGGETGRRYRQTVWFERVRARADHAYLRAHVQALGEVLGGEGEE